MLDPSNYAGTKFRKVVVKPLADAGSDFRKMADPAAHLEQCFVSLLQATRTMWEDSPAAEAERALRRVQEKCLAELGGKPEPSRAPSPNLFASAPGPRPCMRRTCSGLARHLGPDGRAIRFSSAARLSSEGQAGL